jgi:hypothetical protein
MSLVVAIQFLMFGGLSFQQKRYFEDRFFLGSDRRG